MSDSRTMAIFGLVALLFAALQPAEASSIPPAPLAVRLDEAEIVVHVRVLGVKPAGLLTIDHLDRARLQVLTTLKGAVRPGEELTLTYVGGMSVCPPPPKFIADEEQILLLRRRPLSMDWSLHWGRSDQTRPATSEDVARAAADFAALKQLKDCNDAKQRTKVLVDWLLDRMEGALESSSTARWEFWCHVESPGRDFVRLDMKRDLTAAHWQQLFQIYSDPANHDRLRLERIYRRLYANPGDEPAQSGDIRPAEWQAGLAFRPQLDESIRARIEAEPDPAARKRIFLEWLLSRFESEHHHFNARTTLMSYATTGFQAEYRDRSAAAARGDAREMNWARVTVPPIDPETDLTESQKQRVLATMDWNDADRHWLALLRPQSLPLTSRRETKPTAPPLRINGPCLPIPKGVVSPVPDEKGAR